MVSKRNDDDISPSSPFTTHKPTTRFTLTPDLHCPGTWDGWRCVPDTAAGMSTNIQCPDWILGFDSQSKQKRHTILRPMAFSNK